MRHGVSRYAFYSIQSFYYLNNLLGGGFFAGGAAGRILIIRFEKMPARPLKTHIRQKKNAARFGK